MKPSTDFNQAFVVRCVCVCVCMRVYSSFLFTLVFSPSHMNLQWKRVTALRRRPSYVTFSRGCFNPEFDYTHTPVRKRRLLL